MDDLQRLLLEPVDNPAVACCLAAATSFDLTNFTVSSDYAPAVTELSVTSVASAVSAGANEVNRLLRDNLELRQQVGYWKSQWERTRARLAKSEARVEQLQAKVKLRERQLFGRKSEKRSTSEAAKSEATEDAAGRRRGQQRGQPQPQRRDYSHLPVDEAFLDLAADEKQCPLCSAPFELFPGTIDSDSLEIKVRAYIARLRRLRYRPTCHCGVCPGIITAPGPAKLLPKSFPGISIWVTVLVDKFASARPTERLLEDWRTHDLDLAAGTVSAGLQRLTPLLQPLYAALVTQHRQEHHWHADETRWYVFVPVDGKVGHRWYLWMFCSATAVAFVLDPGRAHDVPEEHFGPDANGILNVDRYSAYKAMPQVKSGKIVLSFCWAHQRRDFIGLAEDWPQHEAWAWSWREAIGELYHRNDQRLEVRHDTQAFAVRDQELRQAVAAFEQRWRSELSQPDLHPPCRKVLNSLEEHWQGLLVFVDHPEVPMDNNTGERTIRDPAMGRKNFFGCGALWSVNLAVYMYSLLGTLELWQINPRLWLTAYFQACAANGGKVPAEPEKFLPWNLSAEQLQTFRGRESIPQVPDSDDTG